MEEGFGDVFLVLSCEWDHRRLGSFPSLGCVSVSLRHYKGGVVLCSVAAFAVGALGVALSAATGRALSIMVVIFAAVAACAAVLLVLAPRTFPVLLLSG